MQKKELKELIRLNIDEALKQTKEYLQVYVISFLHNKNADKRKILKEKLKEYLSIIREENKYYEFLLKNLDKIKNEDSLDVILNKLDTLNEKTYLYFNAICTECESSICMREDRDIIPFKDFKTLKERKDLKEETIALATSFYDILNYFSKDDAIYYLVPRTKFLDNADEFYGCFVDENEEIRICMPYIKDKESLEKCIYLYEAGILLYHNLNKNISNKTYDMLAQNGLAKFKEKQLKAF